MIIIEDFNLKNLPQNDLIFYYKMLVLIISSNIYVDINDNEEKEEFFALVSQMKENKFILPKINYLGNIENSEDSYENIEPINEIQLQNKSFIIKNMISKQIVEKKEINGALFSTFITYSLDYINNLEQFPPIEEIINIVYRQTKIENIVEHYLEILKKNIIMYPSINNKELKVFDLMYILF